MFFLKKPIFFSAFGQKATVSELENGFACFEIEKLSDGLLRQAEEFLQSDGKLLLDFIHRGDLSGQICLE